MTTETKPKRMNAKAKEREEFRLKLQEFILKENVRTLWTVLKHVSRSGMSRRIGVYAFTPTGNLIEPVAKRWLSYWAAKALGWRFDERYESVVVDGAGMDMGFHLIYTLSSIIFQDVPREQWPEDLPTRNGEPENSPGYVLQHKWI